MLTAMRLVGASTIADLKPEMVYHSLMGIIMILKLVLQVQRIDWTPVYAKL